MLNWDEINHDNGFILRRAKVFGGWLVNSLLDGCTPTRYSNGYIENERSHEWRSSLTFVPDPNHEWDLNKTY